MAKITVVKGTPLTVSAAFAAKTMLIDVSTTNVATITGLFVNNVNYLPEEVDAWCWSPDFVQQTRTSFLTQLGINDLPLEEIYEYLDAHNLEMPQPNRLDIPALVQGDVISITGVGDFEAEIFDAQG